MGLTIVHCAEDALAAGVAARLVDRMVAERASQPWLREQWGEPSLLAHVRQFVDLQGNGGWSSRSHLKDLRAGTRTRFHPRVSGNAALAYVAVRLACLAPVEGDRALLLSFDVDRHPPEECCAPGVLAALQSAEAPLGVLVAEAQPEFDAWVISGFLPKDAGERSLLEGERRRLEEAGHTFDPVTEPHKLTSTLPGDPRDAKAMCARLLRLEGQAVPTDGRVRECLDAPLETLLTNGAEAGIRGLLSEVVAVLLPLLGDR